VKAHILQHVEFEGIGSMAGWLRRAEAEVRYTRFFANDPLPPIKGLGLVIVMGGPMSVNDEASLPWLAREKQFLREVVAREIPLLGVCLGAQCIASALGAEVRRCEHKEIGWFPVVSTDVATGGFRLPEPTRVFHWHGEACELPPGAVHLARSVGCENQAFRIGRRVLGLQFRLGMTPGTAAALVEHCRHDLVPGRFIQTAEAILGEPYESYAAINPLMDTALDWLTVGSD